MELLKLKVFLGLLVLLNFVARVEAYCFYNKSSDYDCVDVLVFPNEGNAQKFLKAEGWTDQGVDLLFAAGKAVTDITAKTFGETVAEYAAKFVDAMKKITPMYWLGEAAKYITKEVTKIAQHKIDKGKRACWNWNDIRRERKDNNIKDLYFIVFKQGTGYSEILFLGYLNITCALSFKKLGYVIESYPWINDPEKTGREKGGDYEFQGKTYDIVWKYFKDGKKLGLKLAPWVYSGRK